jgi:hypothetical protein
MIPVVLCPSKFRGSEYFSDATKLVVNVIVDATLHQLLRLIVRLIQRENFNGLQAL